MCCIISHSHNAVVKSLISPRFWNIKLAASEMLEVMDNMSEDPPVGHRL